MENTKIGQKLQNLSVEVLKNRLETTRRDLFGFRLNAAVSPVKDTSQYKKLRKQIARILTAINVKSKQSVI